MKTVIIALNSKYIHSSLVPWYLKYSAGERGGKIKVLEFTINDNIEWILSKVFMEKPDCLAFSCYIWNITRVLRLASSLKKVLPDAPVILGGPEVSFDSRELMIDNGFVDFIICGEGENSFGKLLEALQRHGWGRTGARAMPRVRDNPLDGIEGLCYRDGNGEIIYDGKYCIVEDLDSIPTPYTGEMLDSLGNRIVYYEASRGCPFSCSYCISSTFEGVRYFSLDRVKSDICKLIDAGVHQVKFVDRTFNANRKRAKEIIRHIIQASKQACKPCFHFEAAGDLFDDEMLEILAKADEGLIQFEIGVQSVNEKTLGAINRKTDLQKIFKNVDRLKSMGNMHLHLDLIAGLPFEDYGSLQDSFNKVYGLKPHKLQLGFLKMLKGSQIRQRAEMHDYRYRDYPPYEVLCNKYMSFDEMVEFKGIEEIFERYYNSGRFINTLDFVIGRYFDTAFQFYREFYLYNLNAGHLDRAMPVKELYTVFYDFVESLAPSGEQYFINELLKFDFLSTNNSGSLPEKITRHTTRKIERELEEKLAAFLKNAQNKLKYFPEREDVVIKKILRDVRIEVFDHDVMEYAGMLYRQVNLMDGVKAGFNSDSNDYLKDGTSNNSKYFTISRKRTMVLFDYSKRNKLTGLYRYFKVDL
ncbi:MAG: B12-binding domain-containing radical SAM protein [Clostridiaceae bacterium]|nr:B12-binding domain-containing radical SAM protein [Clostridiaceae bacterium]